MSKITGSDLFFRLSALVGLLSVAGASLLQTPRRSMDVVAEWRTVDYEFSSRVARDSAILTGDFIPSNVVVLDVDAYREGKGKVAPIF